MARIEYIQIVSAEQQIADLDVYQLQVIALYEKLLNEDGIYDFLFGFARSGYMTFLEKKDNKIKFYGLTKETLERIKHRGIDPWGRSPIQSLYEDAVVGFCRKMLTHWHKKEPLVDGWGKKYFIELSHQQRGMLTKILKIENKRKQFKGR